MTASELKHEILNEVIKLHEAGYKITFRVDEESVFVFDYKNASQWYAFKDSISQLQWILKKLENISKNNN